MSWILAVEEGKTFNFNFNNNSRDVIKQRLSINYHFLFRLNYCDTSALSHSINLLKSVYVTVCKQPNINLEQAERYCKNGFDHVI